MNRWFGGLLALALVAGPPRALSATHRVSYVGKAQAELDRWGAKAQALEGRSQRAGAKSREELDRLVRHLNGQMQEARDKLEDLKSAAENQWDQRRPAVDWAMADVRRSYRKAWAYFQKHDDPKEP